MRSKLKYESAAEASLEAGGQHVRIDTRQRTLFWLVMGSIHVASRGSAENQVG